MSQPPGIFLKKTHLPKFFRIASLSWKEFLDFPGDSDGSATTTATDGDVHPGHGLWTSVLPWLFALWLGQCRAFYEAKKVHRFTSSTCIGVE